MKKWILVVFFILFLSTPVMAGTDGRAENPPGDDIFSYEQWLTDTQFIPGQSETNYVRVRFIPPGGDTVVTIVVYPLL